MSSGGPAGLWDMSRKVILKMVLSLDGFATSPDGTHDWMFGAAIADLKARDDDGTILVHGGPDFAQSLTRLGVVDEYRLTTVPIAIGAGHSPFGALGEHLKLEVVEEERFRSGAPAQILVPQRSSR